MAIDYEFISSAAVSSELRRMRSRRPLVQCITNDVVQEITANVLLAAGMSPAMVPAPEEAAEFARGAADALLCNVGTPSEENSRGMVLAAESMNRAGKPWTLDPVGAGGTKWRDDLVSRLIDLHPTVIRGNGSEILACAGFEHSYKGVDSLDSSASALDAAKALAVRSRGVVCVSGEYDFTTDGKTVLATRGGSVMATLVVGTGCSLSALTAGFAAGAENVLVSTAACCQFVKFASEAAARASKGPGSFHDEYLDALYEITPESLARS
ncbi:MAG: hydroxyethylthiazole kinase [Sutterellaceae bacterium]|nr:hydroxyethylthiazole kinase [Sutterellaceae bacterium]MDD7441889.1 hydroxyethylthiazole kinase [Sutterellaceae bacterium]MDY2867415.1 hydroxyethylthiazole kinase [Mesosutterella sp.]